MWKSHLLFLIMVHFPRSHIHNHQFNGRSYGKIKKVENENKKKKKKLWIWKPVLPSNFQRMAATLICCAHLQFPEVSYRPIPPLGKSSSGSKYFSMNQIVRHFRIIIMSFLLPATLHVIFFFFHMLFVSFFFFY